MLFFTMFSAYTTENTALFIDMVAQCIWLEPTQFGGDDDRVRYYH